MTGPSLGGATTRATLPSLGWVALGCDNWPISREGSPRWSGPSLGKKALADDDWPITSEACHKVVFINMLRPVSKV